MKNSRCEPFVTGRERDSGTAPVMSLAGYKQTFFQIVDEITFSHVRNVQWF
jgi:hypothetical protein